jgi:5-methylcytosine-specific restriction protein A
MSKVNRPWHKPQVKHARSVDNSKFYNSRTWRNARKRFLDKNPMCVACDSDEVITPANVVDHIVSITNGGAKLEENNFQAMCTTCHNKKSAKESAKQRGRGIIIIGASRRTSRDR